MPDESPPKKGPEPQVVADGGGSYGSPSVVMRLAAPPLLAYHALILVGAYVVVRGDTSGSLLLLGIGLAMVVAGILTELAVLAWSAGLTRHSAALPSARPTREVEPGRSGPAARRICWSCGWSGDGPGTICPRCARPLVRRSA